MPLRWYTTVIESRDPHALARWWADALGWDYARYADDEAGVLPPWARELAPTLPFHQVPPGLCFVQVEHDKSTKNRLHLDLAPHTSDDRDAEIARLLDLGATLADVGQGPDVSWTVLADPDGNEFCVLSSREQ
ncbi:VOC family protein [Cellulomonas sp. zg-ZUI222]|uniref:VOC family protein n=1 Tax=Cellulomonas wangleii TaxID=2816956 RepID=A0ABX8D2Y2_9CELL|nr:MULTISPECIES: VOC family protein [Cellulomonas]MBO0899249.1 VOC family protein [Cellulomonas sp. zg-ZUI22]MBO0920100.1 VOC family protein [Cellulomonas wangleii]MBO0923471.1 VOC family protein [Cellulomonas wangleii]QVI61815.1 VOC family protein [Cellulomonas wangleii]